MFVFLIIALSFRANNIQNHSCDALVGFKSSPDALAGRGLKLYFVDQAIFDGGKPYSMGV